MGVVINMALHPYIFKGAVVIFNFVLSPLFRSIDEVNAVRLFGFDIFGFGGGGGCGRRWRTCFIHFLALLTRYGHSDVYGYVYVYFTIFIFISILRLLFRLKIQKIDS